ncbi:MAG: hypothetical protein ACOH5I_20880 [Oligoflexus sp.]
MKMRSLIVGIASLFVQQAIFAQTKPFVTKTNVTGFTLPEYSRLETCEVYLDKVVLTKKYGIYSETGFTTQEERPVTISPSIKQILKAAIEENLEETDNYLCDGPSTTVSSNFADSTSTLFATGGCGSPRLERVGGASQMLMELVGSYCPVTHDFGSEFGSIE